MGSPEHPGLVLEQSRKSGSDDDLLPNFRTVFAARDYPSAVELGSTSITVANCWRFRAGDVARLDRGVDGELPIVRASVLALSADLAPWVATARSR